MELQERDFCAQLRGFSNGKIQNKIGGIGVGVECNLKREDLVSEKQGGFHSVPFRRNFEKQIWENIKVPVSVKLGFWIYISSTG